MMTASVVDDLTDTPSSKNRECTGLGIANAAASLFGGIAGCGMIGQTVSNVKYGGRGRLSTLFAGAFLLVLMVLLKPWVSQVPVAALVAIMVMVSIDTFDWSFIADGGRPSQDVERRHGRDRSRHGVHHQPGTGCYGGRPPERRVLHVQGRPSLAGGNRDRRCCWSFDISCLGPSLLRIGRHLHRGVRDSGRERHERSLSMCRKHTSGTSPPSRPSTGWFSGSRRTAFPWMWWD